VSDAAEGGAGGVDGAAPGGEEAVGGVVGVERTSGVCGVIEAAAEVG